MDSFSFPPQVESLESREMWKGFILTVVEVRAVACSEPSFLFSSYIHQTSLLSHGGREPGGAHRRKICKSYLPLLKSLEFLSTFLISLLVICPLPGPCRPLGLRPYIYSSI